VSPDFLSKRLLNRLAVASLVCSLVTPALLLALIGLAPFGGTTVTLPFSPMRLIYTLTFFSLVAIVVGHLVNRRLLYSDENRKARRRAETSKMLGYAFFAVMVFSILFVPNPDADRGNLAPEASNVGTIRAIVHVEEEFAKAPGSKGYTCSLQELKPLLADSFPYASSEFFETGKLAGYITELTDCTPRTFHISGTPRIFDKTGHRIFCADETGVIRYLRENVPASKCFVRGEPLR
jgi:hypothetical protein